ncbi:MAG: ARMT1-like domain-containing protein [Thermoplasmata archaeon]
MKMRAQCVPCITRRILMEINEVDPSREMEVMVECAKVLADNIYDGVPSSVCSTKVHARAYEMLSTDPYAKLKEKSTVQASELMPRAREFVESADDPFHAAVLCSIVGNVLDYGIDRKLDAPGYLVGHFEDLLKEGLAVDHTPRMREILEKARNVIFMPDNMGEILFDQLLIEQLRKFDVKITMIVKGAPILTDVTMPDAIALGLDKQVDKIITTGGFAVGFPFWDMGDELKDTLENADFIISKGMGNFECFTETDYKPLAYLMRVKCEPVSDTCGAPMRSNVAIVVE